MTRLLLIAALASAGCNREAPRPAPVSESPSGTPYDVRTPAVTLQAGATARATLEVVPRAPWKMNDEYPTKVTVSAAGDAVRLEHTAWENLPGQARAIDIADTALRLHVPLHGVKAGTTQLTGRLRFAVCTPETCVPHEEDVSWQVTVTD